MVLIENLILDFLHTIIIETIIASFSNKLQTSLVMIASVEGWGFSTSTTHPYFFIQFGSFPTNGDSRVLDEAFCRLHLTLYYVLF